MMKLSRTSRTVVIATVTAIAVTAPGFGLAAAYAYAGDIPRNTSVLGLEIGAMSQGEAVEALRAHLDEHADTLAAPVAVRVDEEQLELDPAALDLAVDVEATVARAAELTPNPFDALYGSRVVDPVVEVDAEALDERLADAAEGASEAMTMPEIYYEGLEPVVVYPEPGYGLAPESSAQALAAGWPPPLGEPAGSWRAAEVINVPLVPIHPVTTAEELDALVQEYALPAVAAPVTVTLDDRDDVDVPPEAVAASLRFTADSDGEVSPELDPADLREALAAQLDDLESEPRDATMELVDGSPTVREGRDGVELDTEALADELLEILPEPAPRQVEGEITITEPDLTTEEAHDLGVVEEISSFTTHFEGGLSQPRNQNISILAADVDGTLVLPGEVFSLNEHTGERGYDQGYQDAPAIVDGRLQPSPGGGNSQFTTTLFNAALYAGLEDIEHNPHSYYYSRYPAVLESTIWYPALDLKFRNDTPYGVLIDTSVTNDSVTARMWSTPVWDEVTTEWGPRRDVTEPETRYVEPGPDCIATSGIPGFTQDAWRIFHRDGEEVKREKFTWRYDAQPNVICGEEPDD